MLPPKRFKLSDQTTSNPRTQQRVYFVCPFTRGDVNFIQRLMTFCATINPLRLKVGVL